MDNKKMNSTGVEDHILDVEHLSMYFTTKNRGKKSTVKAVDDVSFYVKRGRRSDWLVSPAAEKQRQAARLFGCMIPPWEL